MLYCPYCGEKLSHKKDGIDGLVPYCLSCERFIYPTFNVAISAIVENQNGEILLIKQYKKNDYILVAGYVSIRECAEEALFREIKEETGLIVLSYRFNKTAYYEKTNTLMINFTAYVSNDSFVLSEEVDSASWFKKEDAIKNIKDNSLAKEFLKYYLEKK